MALVPMGGGGGGMDPRYRQMMSAQLIGNAIGGFGGAMELQKQKAALGQLLAGTPAKMDPGVASLDIRKAQGGPGFQTSTPGLLQTGQLTPQMAQAYMLQGGDPAALASMMPQQMDPYQQAKLGIDTQKLELERQKMAQGPGPMSGIGKVMADFGLDPSNPEHVQRASEIMKSSSGGGTSIEVKVPPGYPAAPQGMHYAGDFSRPETVQLEPTPGYEPEIAGDAARVTALAPGALQDLQAITGGLVGPDGSINRDAVAQMNLPVVGDVPGTAGSGLRSKMEGALDLMTVMRTGASATAEQMAAYRRAYMPSPLDSDETIRDKMARFQRDVGSALAINQRGRGAVPEPAPAPATPSEPSLMDQLWQQGSGLAQGMMGGGAPTQPPQAQPAPQMMGGGASGAPAVGAVEDGFRFKGGNPADPNSWEPAR